MKETWARFEDWLRANFKDGYDGLNPPAEENSIAELEAKVSVKLPRDFVEFMRCHDGQRDDIGGLVDCCELLSINRILDEWDVWNGLYINGDFNEFESDPADGVKSDWWNPKWIPFTYDGGGNHLCLDLDPAEGGAVGQVITMWHDDGERKVVARSFEKWFRDYVSSVESGKYVYSDEYDAVVDVDEIS